MGGKKSESKTQQTTNVTYETAVRDIGLTGAHAVEAMEILAQGALEQTALIEEGSVAREQAFLAAATERERISSSRIQSLTELGKMQFDGGGQFIGDVEPGTPFTTPAEEAKGMSQNQMLLIGAGVLALALWR
jgi:hypothetical protein